MRRAVGPRPTSSWHSRCRRRQGSPRFGQGLAIRRLLLRIGVRGRRGRIFASRTLGHHDRIPLGRGFAPAGADAVEAEPVLPDWAAVRRPADRWTRTPRCRRPAAGLGVWPPVWSLAHAASRQPSTTRARRRSSRTVVSRRSPPAQTAPALRRRSSRSFDSVPPDARRPSRLGAQVDRDWRGADPRRGEVQRRRAPGRPSRCRGTGFLPRPSDQRPWEPAQVRGAGRCRAWALPASRRWAAGLASAGDFVAMRRRTRLAGRPSLPTAPEPASPPASTIRPSPVAAPARRRRACRAGRRNGSLGRGGGWHRSGGRPGRGRHRKNRRQRRGNRNGQPGRRKRCGRRSEIARRRQDARRQRESRRRGARGRRGARWQSIGHRARHRQRRWWRCGSCRRQRRCRRNDTSRRRIHDRRLPRRSSAGWWRHQGRIPRRHRVTRRHSVTQRHCSAGRHRCTRRRWCTRRKRGRRQVDRRRRAHSGRK